MSLLLVWFLLLLLMLVLLGDFSVAVAVIVAVSVTVDIAVVAFRQLDAQKLWRLPFALCHMLLQFFGNICCNYSTYCCCCRHCRSCCCCCCRLAFELSLGAFFCYCFAAPSLLGFFHIFFGSVRQGSVRRKTFSAAGCGLLVFGFGFGFLGFSVSRSLGFSA